jgi:hypothetical protein
VQELGTIATEPTKGERRGPDGIDELGEVLETVIARGELDR